jgi:hypothetical protein
MARKRIGAMLEERGLITEFQLVAALSHQRKWKGKLGRSLIELGYLEEQKLYEVLAEQMGMTFVDLRSRQIPLEVLSKISRKDAQALKAVPVELKGTTVVVAVAEPDRPDLQAALAKAAGQPVELVLGLESAIEVLNASMSDKVPVTTIQPVKKAFIRNHRGEMEPLEGFPGAEPQPAPTRAKPPAYDDAPIALDDGDSDPFLPAPAPSPKLPEPEPLPPPVSASPEPTRSLNIPDLELPPPPAPPAAVSTPEPKPLIPDPPVAPAAAPDLPEDLWAMPKPEDQMAPAPESGPPFDHAAGGMDLPPPPSLDLSDLPPPPSPTSSGTDLKAMPSVPELDLAPPEEIPLPEGDEKEPPLTQVPSLELPLEDPQPAPKLELKPDPLPEPPEMQGGAKEKSFDQLIPSLLEDLSSLTASSKKSKEEEPAERIEAKPPAPPAEPLKPLETETPSWIEPPHASSPPMDPIEGLVTEDVKADAVAFQQEIHRAERLASGEKTEPELEVAPHDALDRRLAKLEEEVQKLRETVESLVLKIRP